MAEVCARKEQRASITTIGDMQYNVKLSIKKFRYQKKEQPQRPWRKGFSKSEQKRRVNLL